MTPSAALLALPVAIPITSAVLAPLLARISRHLSLIMSLAAMAATTLTLMLFAPQVYSGHIVTHFLGGWTPVDGAALGVAFVADPFGLTFALVCASVGGVLLLHTLSSLGGLGTRELGSYACLFQLLLAALIGVALTADSVNVFVWFEVAALASYGLTAFFLERPLALEAGFKIMVLTNIAGFCVFLGAALLYSDHGALNFGQLHDALQQSVLPADMVALGLLLAGLLTKSGIVPFHGWLPDAHTAAPGPVSALFSGLMVALGVVVCARLVLQVFPAGSGHSLGVLTTLGVISAIAGAALALGQDDLKRVLAYDTVSQMGILFVGLGLATSTSLAGMTYHLINHALFKSLLFLCAGAIVHATGMTRLSQMGGLARHRRTITVAFLVGAAAICGMPPLDGYVSVGLIHDAVRQDAPALLPFMVLAQVLTVAALARAAYLAFFRRRDDDYDRLDPPRPGMVIAFGVLALGCVLSGVFPFVVLDHVAAPAAAGLLQGGTYATAAMGTGATLTVTSVDFQAFSPVEVVTALGTVALGLLLARWYVRLARDPLPIRLLRAFHTGSVNDYVAYAATGLVAVTAVLLLR